MPEPRLLYGVPYLPFSPADPYWSGVPVVRLADGDVELVSGDLDALGVSMATVRQCAQTLRLDNSDDDRFGVLANPFGDVHLIGVGDVPEEDWRYEHDIHLCDDWEEDLPGCLQRAEQIIADLRLAEQLGWEAVHDLGTDQISLREPAYRQSRLRFFVASDADR